MGLVLLCPARLSNFEGTGVLISRQSKTSMQGKLPTSVRTPSSLVKLGNRNTALIFSCGRVFFFGGCPSVFSCGCLFLSAPIRKDGVQVARLDLSQGLLVDPERICEQSAVVKVPKISSLPVPGVIEQFVDVPKIVFQGFGSGLSSCSLTFQLCR